MREQDELDARYREIVAQEEAVSLSSEPLAISGHYLMIPDGAEQALQQSKGALLDDYRTVVSNYLAECIESGAVQQRQNLVALHGEKGREIVDFACQLHEVFGSLLAPHAHERLIDGYITSLEL